MGRGPIYCATRKRERERIFFFFAVHSSPQPCVSEADQPPFFFSFFFLFFLIECFLWPPEPRAASQKREAPIYIYFLASSVSCSCQAPIYFLPGRFFPPRAPEAEGGVINNNFSKFYLFILFYYYIIYFYPHTRHQSNTQRADDDSFCSPIGGTIEAISE